MKKIAVVATEKEYAEFLKENVAKYMNRYADFIAYSVAEVEEIPVLEEDFVLISAFNIFQQTKKKISGHSEIIVLSLSLSKRQVEMLKDIPAGTRALLVNFDNRSSMFTITSMYDAGIRDLELYPYHGVGGFDRTIKVAITPNESHLVPEGMEKVYDIGESSVDMNSLYNIAEKLGVYDEFSAREANEARKEYYYLNSSIDKLLNEKESMTDKMNTLIRLMNEGIIIVDSVGRIYLANEKASELLKERSKVLLGFNIEEILPELDINSTKDKLIKTPSANLVAASVEIRSKEEIVGHIITLADFEEREERQHGMRSSLRETSHTARYHFEDILGESPVIRRAVGSAREIAGSDGAVMITGESGTGKEMFAQSIHNASSRRKYNFVAVNCAAIPENLLESEMFGYEEGSFTGARKGGRMGFFELAHRGTIFLDEIAELPLQLQSKLLRVLEEKRVMRVGSDRNIDIDVRIISATNRDLFVMVEKGEFREDLYYRLNVLPVFVPPLRERREDILLIFDALVRGMNGKIELSDAARDILLHASWRGNVRELRNVAEFLVSKRKSYIEAEDLPPMRSELRRSPEKRAEAARSTVIDKFLLNEGRDIEMYRTVLRVLSESMKRGERYGRRRLTEEINGEGDLYTEGEVRKALFKLSSYGFVRSPRGRGGSRITTEGVGLLDALEEFSRSGLLK